MYREEEKTTEKLKKKNKTDIERKRDRVSRNIDRGSKR